MAATPSAVSTSSTVNVLVDEDPRGYLATPILYPSLWELYHKHRNSYWREDEIPDYEKAGKEFRTLPDDERHFLEHVLAFFASSDGIVNRNITDNFGAEINLMEARFFYQVQQMMESIHALTYTRLLQNFVPDPTRQERLFRALETMPAVAAKCKWAERWMDAGRASLGERLVAFAAVEGIFFSGSFCAIFWAANQYPGKMTALKKSNEFICRDEGLHCDFAIALFKLLPEDQRPSTGRVIQIVRDAVSCEEAFIKGALPRPLLNMNAESMTTHIRSCADFMLQKLVGNTVFNVSTPFDFMAKLALDGKSNFFETRVSEYNKAVVGDVESAFEGGDDF